MISIKLKAAIFDKFVAEMQGSHHYVGAVRKIVRSDNVWPILSNESSVEVKDVRVFEWRIRANESTDFLQCMINILSEKERKEIESE